MIWGPTLLKWMIWGAHPYFWKHPYKISNPFFITEIEAQQFNSQSFGIGEDLIGADLDQQKRGHSLPLNTAKVCILHIGSEAAGQWDVTWQTFSHWRVFADFLALMKDGWVLHVRDVTGDRRVYIGFTSSFEYMLLLHTMIFSSKDCMSRPLRETIYCIQYPCVSHFKALSDQAPQYGVKHPWVARSAGAKNYSTGNLMSKTHWTRIF